MNNTFKSNEMLYRPFHYPTDMIHVISIKLYFCLVGSIKHEEEQTPCRLGLSHQ